jgi:hypothetical protein
LGKILLADATVTKEIKLCQEIKKLKRATEEEAMWEAARLATLAEKRAKSLIFSPNLQTLLATADADRRDRGLPVHTIESFLLYLQEQVQNLQAAHQNSAPQDPMEQDLHRIPGRSQGAPAEGHCPAGR